MWWWSLLAAAEPSALDAIRGRWTQVQGLREEGALYAFELNANPADRPWAAVGTYSHVTTCHRSVREEGPYPDPEPILVTVHVSVSAHDEARTFLYSDAGALLFAHATSNDNPSWRVYWADQAVLRVQHADAVVTSVRASEAASSLQAQGKAVFETCASTARATDTWKRLPALP